MKDLARVYRIDEGSVGHRGASHRRQGAHEAGAAGRRGRRCWSRPPRPRRARGAPSWGWRWRTFAAGDEAKAREALDAALDANPHYGKALLGRVRRRVENVAGARPGSLEEALLYTQTYGDVWTDAAKAFLEKVLDERAEAKSKEKAAAPAADEDEAAAPRLAPASSATSSLPSARPASPRSSWTACRARRSAPRAASCRSRTTARARRDSRWRSRSA